MTAMARDILDLVPWRFVLALDVARGEELAVPARLVQDPQRIQRIVRRQLLCGIRAPGGLRTGRTPCLRLHRPGAADLADHRPGELAGDPVLAGLLAAFDREGVRVWLKDVSLGLSVPTVAALAYDPATFPRSSEIVFTAGTASSPTKGRHPGPDRNRPAGRRLRDVEQLRGLGPAQVHHP